jgi:hypothetical protein
MLPLLLLVRLVVFFSFPPVTATKALKRTTSTRRGVL